MTAVTEHPRIPARAARRAPLPDRTRSRAATLNQALLATVVLVLSVLVAVDSYSGDGPLFFAGALVVFAGLAAALVIPWDRLPYGLTAIVPAADIIAIMVMRASAPSSRLALLWVFPTMWIAAGFGLLGMFGAITGVCLLFWATLVLQPSGALTYDNVLLPLIVLAVGVTSFLTARRTAAQRTLLSTQAQLLSRVLERTRRQEQEVTEVLDAVDFGVIRVGADGATAVTNDAYGRLQTLDVDDTQEGAAPVFRADGETPVPAGEMPLERALRGDAFDDDVVWFGEPGPARRALSVSARRLTDDTGADAGAVVVSRDVTGELTALRARDELVASVSHELRTPLTSILGYLELALDADGLPDGARANLRIAERNAERLLGIVGDILAASSSSATPALTMSPRELDVAEIARASAESLSPRATRKAVILDAGGLEEATAYADPLRLRQVVDNLIANAIAYNRDGGTVTIGTTTDGTSTWLLVRDTGVGIPDDEQERVFERFYRAEGVRGQRRGSGLGLAISRDFVRAQGGDITLRSTVGVGSTFVVRLPARPPAEESR
ncbi:sensor histidine kinase [Microbacterium rhizosphaerae]|uniref:histidine kinase n=1 Tax=Microbacterium rhizosphaerae TaxID=1678237 RepID=A0ABZ0SH35_9MICO|nr:HAMP domain-containing sensor histidine kinase [Microbacterium rhizosphaerae]WPR88178.1 HAMP domain-containing sensor histidine kinase [Microbacterium rhizosphaerae]